MATASFVTDLTEIITQAAEAAAGLAGVYNGFKILGIAQDYYDLYKDQRQYYYSTFQQGVEAPLANEIYTDPKPVLDYAARLAAGYNAVTGPFGGKATDMRGWWERHANAYSSIPDPMLVRESETDIQRVKSDWTNYWFRFEEIYYDLALDIRWRKRLALHNVGIKQGTAVSSAMDSALREYTTHMQDFGNQMATYGNGIAAYAGYKKGLADPADDVNAMEYDTAMRTPNYTYGIRPLGPSNGVSWNFGT